MESKYQKYYDKLKGKNFGSCVNRYSSAIDAVKGNTNSISSSITSNSNVWKEKGISTLQSSTIPGLVNATGSVEKGLSSLSQAVSKCNSLVSKLSELDSVCKMYDSAKEEDKSIYQNKIDVLEAEADAIISEINSISVEKGSSDNTVASGTSTSVSTASTNVVSGDIASKKAAFLGDVDDPSQYTLVNNYKSIRKQMTAFDNTTGEVLEEGSVVNMKPGETRVITVKLPTNTGMIGELRRTTADGDGTFRSGNVVTARSDVNPDPNVIDYVNYKSTVNHYPKGVDLHANHYDWVITAKSDGTATISQTCEYSSKDDPNWYGKAMFDLKVNVSS